MGTGAAWAVFAVIVVNTLFLAGIAVALWFLNGKLNQALTQVQPLLDTTTKTLQNVEQLSITASERLNRLLDRTGEVVENVSRKVESTTSLAEETISQPLISAASLMAGISQGLNVYQATQEKGE